MNIPQHVLDNIAVGVIAPSNIHGFGLFASRDLPVGALLSVLDGQRVPWEIYRFFHEGSGDAFNEWNALSPVELLVRPFRTKYSFINHSRSPNCKAMAVNGAVVVETLSFIPSGEELTLDYRMEPLPSEYLAGHGATYL